MKKPGILCISTVAINMFSNNNVNLLSVQSNWHTKLLRRDSSEASEPTYRWWVVNLCHQHPLPTTPTPMTKTYTMLVPTFVKKKMGNFLKVGAKSRKDGNFSGKNRRNFEKGYTFCMHVPAFIRVFIHYTWDEYSNIRSRLDVMKNTMHTEKVFDTINLGFTKRVLYLV